MSINEKAIEECRKIQEKLGKLSRLSVETRLEVELDADWSTISELSYINEKLAEILAFWNNEE